MAKKENENEVHELQAEIKALQTELQKAREEIAQLKGRGPYNIDFAAERAKTARAGFKTKGTQIEILKRGTNDRYPHSFFSIAIMPPGDRSMKDIEAAAAEKGPGDYILRSWEKQAGGWNQICGQLEITI